MLSWPDAVPGQRLPLPSGQSLPPRTANPSRGSAITGHQRRFTRFTRPACPSPVIPGWDGDPRAFPCASHPAVTGSARQGGAGREHAPGTTRPTFSALQSASPLAKCDLVSQRQMRAFVVLHFSLGPISDGFPPAPNAECLIRRRPPGSRAGAGRWPAAATAPPGPRPLAQPADAEELVRRAQPPHRPSAGYRLGSDRGSPSHGSTLLSKRVMPQIRSPARVST